MKKNNLPPVMHFFSPAIALIFFAIFFTSCGNKSQEQKEPTERVVLDPEDGPARFKQAIVFNGLVKETINGVEEAASGFVVRAITSDDQIIPADTSHGSYSFPSGLDGKYPIVVVVRKQDKYLEAHVLDGPPLNGIGPTFTLDTAPDPNGRTHELHVSVLDALQSGSSGYPVTYQTNALGNTESATTDRDGNWTFTSLVKGATYCSVYLNSSNLPTITFPTSRLTKPSRIHITLQEEKKK